MNNMNEEIEVIPSGRIDYCGQCKKEHGYNCPLDDKNKGGRPTKYTPELLQLALEYLDTCQDESIQETVGMSAKGTELFKNKLTVKIPTKGGLARYLKVSRETLYAWAKEYPEFSDIMEEVGAEQEDRLINKGLSGDYSPTIAKVLLSKHGYREGIDQTTNDKDLPTPILGNIIKTSDVIQADNSTTQDTEIDEED